MSETYDWGETYARGGHDQTAAGRVIVMAAGFMAAVLVIAGLVYATGTSARHKAALAAAGCEPSLFISGLPCTTQQMVISQYEGIVPPASKQLNADMAAYRANERRNLVAAEAALTAEVATVQALDNSLAAVAFTPQNRATALALITTAFSSGNPVPSAAIMFTPQATAMADALVRANQALAKLTAEQARSSSLTQLRSFNHRVQVASAAVQTDMKLLREAVAAPPAAGQEP
jgi:hypothetical protein